LNGGTLRVNGSTTVNGIKMTTTLGASAKLATTSASDVMTVGNALNEPSGGAANTVLHVTGPGTVLLSQQANYIGEWSLDSGITQLGTSAGLGTGPNLNISAGAIFDLTLVTSGGSTYTLGTTALSASGTGTTVGTTAATINADPSGFIDLGSTTPSISLTFAPTGFSGDTTHPALYIASGTLSLTGNAFSINNAAATPLGIGTYKLIQQATGNITAGGGYSVTGVTGGGVASGAVASIVVNGGEVDLVVSAYTPKSLVWTGGSANANWDIANDANWLNGTIYSQFHNSDVCTFNSVGSTNPTVSLVGTLAPGSVTVNTTANNYTFSGSGSIAGDASLLKIGTGTLLLNTANTYGGGTVISNGVIQLGINNAISGTGSGNVTVSSPGILDMNGNNDSIDALVGNGTLDTVVGGAPVLTVGNNDNSGTFSGVIQNTTGTLGLTKNGNGTETLSGANTYSGPTTVNAGILSAASFQAFGASTVTLNNGTLDLQTNVLVGTLAGTGGMIANDFTSTTNDLEVTNTSTFGGTIEDGTSGGFISVLVAGGTLRLNAANTYSGGTIVESGAGLAIGTGASSAGTGGIIASNNATISQPNTGSSSSSMGNNITTVHGATVTFTSASTANLWGGQFFGDATATNIYSGGNMSVGGSGGTMQFSNFVGTVIVTNGEIRWGTGAGPWGGDDTTFIFTGIGGCFARDNTIIHLGALFGNGVIGNTSVNPSGTYWIGAKNLSSEYSGQINGSNNIVKTGTGTLTLDGSVIATNTDNSTFTNYLYSQGVAHIGTTTVSNGVLVITAPNNLSSNSVITLAGSNAVLNAMNMGYVSNFNDASGNADSVVITNGLVDVSSTPSVLTGLPQTLSGYGTIQGKLLVENGAILNPGLPTGPLTVTGQSEFAGEVLMNLDATNTPNSSEFVCSNIKVDSTATLVVTNWSGLVNGTTFTLFSKPITGFASVSLPATDPTGTTNYTWANNLSVNGTITLTAGGVSPIASNPTNIVFSVSGGNLTLSWPADHTGWYLQSQTNSVSKGLGTNWVDVPGSSTLNSITVPINAANPAIFYRMSLNP
jgi:fibronectin-binding autotransporter adhesin